MKKIDLFNAIIEEGFDPEVALTALGMMTINLTKKIKNKHMRVKGMFTTELKAKFKKHFHDITDEVYDEALSLWEVMYVYECGIELDGVGGGKSQTFRELLKEELDNQPTEDKV